MQLKKSIAVSESGLVFDPNNGESFTLNDTAIDILNLLKQSKATDEIEKFITGKYDVDASTFMSNYEDFVRMLKHHQLVENE